MQKMSKGWLLVLGLVFQSAAFGFGSAGVEASQGYAQAVEKLLQEMQAQPSPMTDQDLNVMETAAKKLADQMPDPGLPVGSNAPMFELSNAFGKSVTLADMLQQGPVVLTFYRGAWCPFCNLHLHKLQEALPEFQQYGAQLVAISPQKPDKSAEQLKQEGYPFEVLSDLNSDVMKAYQLYFELEPDLLAVYKKFDIDLDEFNGEGRYSLPVPGTFVIDTKGVIRAMQAQTDYKKRMEPVDVLEALKRIVNLKE